LHIASVLEEAGEAVGVEKAFAEADDAGYRAGLMIPHIE
jgi:hypothetical protein